MLESVRGVRGVTRSLAKRLAGVSADESVGSALAANITLYNARYSTGCRLHTRGGTIPEITMRYVSRYLSHDTIRITILR